MPEADRSTRARPADYRSRVRGCLLGGAIGDALGAPVEFHPLAQIRAECGPDGLTGPVLDGGRAVVTDDTQMTLFTVEGLIRAGGDVPPAVYRAYLRWLDTQRRPGPPDRPDGWLAAQAWLYAQRAPGTACLSGLGTGWMGTPRRPQNPDSKGCGTVMRSAPFGLRPDATPDEAFALAVECSALTHGHPTAGLAAGAFAAIVRVLLDGRDLADAVGAALDLLVTERGHGEVTAVLRSALAFPGSASDVAALGGGWVADEALGIGVACALAHPDPADIRTALLLAVNHSGDSDSTGSICGNLLGARHGERALPADWLATLEGRDTIAALADEFVATCTPAG